MYKISSQLYHILKCIKKKIILIIILLNSNLIIFNSLNKKIRIGLVANSLKNGGIERASSLMCFYFNKIKLFKFQ